MNQLQSAIGNISDELEISTRLIKMRERSLRRKELKLRMLAVLIVSEIQRIIAGLIEDEMDVSIRRMGYAAAAKVIAYLQTKSIIAADGKCVGSRNGNLYPGGRIQGKVSLVARRQPGKIDITTEHAAVGMVGEIEVDGVGFYCCVEAIGRLIIQKMLGSRDFAQRMAVSSDDVDFKRHQGAIRGSTRN